MSSMYKIFNTPCCSRCICKEIANKDRIIVCLSDPRNADNERLDRDVLVRDYDRQLEDDGKVTKIDE